MKGTPSNSDAPAPGDSGDIVVFSVRRDTKCAECDTDLHDGEFLRMEKDRPLCLACADLGHLEFLPAGNTALTRRATKHSPLRAVVVRWSRSRKRYERQGILVAPEAIVRAESECLADEEQRERTRARAAIRRDAEDVRHETEVAHRIRQLYPGCPADEAERIAAWTCRRHSGRVGRSAAAKDLDPAALRLAVVAHIRHEHTRYDEELMEHGDRQRARDRIRGDVDRVLARWEQPAESGQDPAAPKAGS